MCIRPECDVAVDVVEQPRESSAHPFRHFEGSVPLAVEILGGVQPGLLLSVKSTVGPCLVRVTGQEQPFADTETRIELSERIWVLEEKFRKKDHRPNSDRIAHRSGNAGWSRVVLR